MCPSTFESLWWWPGERYDHEMFTKYSLDGYEVEGERFLWMPSTENFLQQFEFCYSKSQKKSGFGEKVNFFKIQMFIKSVIFNIQTWNFQNHLVSTKSSFFVFYSKRFDQDLKFRKSRNLTFRARSLGMVWPTKFSLSSKFTFGSNISLETLLNFVSQVF